MCKWLPCKNAYWDSKRFCNNKFIINLIFLILSVPYSDVAKQIEQLDNFPQRYLQDFHLNMLPRVLLLTLTQLLRFASMYFFFFYHHYLWKNRLKVALHSKALGVQNNCGVWSTQHLVNLISQLFKKTIRPVVFQKDFGRKLALNQESL